VEWAVATRHAPIAMVARRKLRSGQMRRVCRRLRPWYVPSRLDSVGAGRCSMIEPVEQAPVPPTLPPAGARGPGGTMPLRRPRLSRTAGLKRGWHVFRRTPRGWRL